MTSAAALRRVLKKLDGSSIAPSRVDYEAYLVKQRLLGKGQTLAEAPDIAGPIYRDWQRRPQVACEFAKYISQHPHKFNVDLQVVNGDPKRDMKSVVETTATIVQKGRNRVEGLSVLLPALVDQKTLVVFCKRLGACVDWRIDANFNPSDKLQRVYVGLKFRLNKNVEAEVLGLGPFDFLPATRRAPITALEIRLKSYGAKKRGRSRIARSHLADIPWPDGNRSRLDSAWEQTKQARREVLGGDDSAARARITFAIPRSLWNERED